MDAAGVNYLIAVQSEEGVVLLYDMYRNGEWIGSRRTLDQCSAELTWEYVIGKTAEVPA